MSRHRFTRIGKMNITSFLNSERSANHGAMTIAIVGVPRGGTTMVAAAVNALGIDLGPANEMDKFHFEDQTMHRPYPEIQYRYICKRDVQHKVWGWKDPIGISSVIAIIYALRNPHVIVVFRDMLATIQAEQRFDREYEVDPPRTLQQLTDITLGWWRENLTFINNTRFPTLLVSYERAILHPGAFVDELARFLQVKLTDELQAKALSRVGARGGYLVTNSAWRREQGE